MFVNALRISRTSSQRKCCMPHHICSKCTNFANLTCKTSQVYIHIPLCRVNGAGGGGGAKHANSVPVYNKRSRTICTYYLWNAFTAAAGDWTDALASVQRILRSFSSESRYVVFIEWRPKNQFWVESDHKPGKRRWPVFCLTWVFTILIYLLSMKTTCRLFIFYYLKNLADTAYTGIRSGEILKSILPH